MSKAPRGEYIVPQFSSHISSAPGVYERWKARVAARPVFTALESMNRQGATSPRVVREDASRQRVSPSSQLSIRP
jgi:hypothetical protein